VTDILPTKNARQPPSNQIKDDCTA